jgi:hypothetical protein
VRVVGEAVVALARRSHLVRERLQLPWARQLKMHLGSNPRSVSNTQMCIFPSGLGLIGTMPVP